MGYTGRVHKFGDNVNTDEIMPARYLDTIDAGELALHCMEGARPHFAKKVKKGDIIVAGKNFGCGSSREHAPVAIKAGGVSCVVAKSFARIFYRNAINIGLPIVESESAPLIKNGGTITVDTVKGIIAVKGKKGKKAYPCEKYPPFLQGIIKKGGLMAYLKKR